MAFFEIQNLKILWGNMPPDPQVWFEGPSALHLFLVRTPSRSHATIRP